MRHTVRIACLLALSLLGTGLQWDLLQVVAWSTMVAGHAEKMDLVRAVETTFDGEMCPICRVVEKAKQQQSRDRAPAATADARRLLFFHTTPIVVIPGPRVQRAWPADSPAPREIRWAPPVPPPRAIA